MPTEITNERNAVAEQLAVSPAEAARLAGVGRTTVYEAIGSGALRSLKIGKRRLILIVSLRAWLEAAQHVLDEAAQERAHDPKHPRRENSSASALCHEACNHQAERSPRGDRG